MPTIVSKAMEIVNEKVSEPSTNVQTHPAVSHIKIIKMIYKLPQHTNLLRVILDAVNQFSILFHFLKQ